MAEFQLSAELRGHEKDVRSVVFPSPDLVVSGSRDSTTVLWRKVADKFTKSSTLPGQHYVNSLSYFSAAQSNSPDGLLVRGFGDNLIEINNPNTPEDDHKRLLVGHAGNVCALDVSPDGSYLVSGSWDAKSLVWSTKTWDPELSLVHGEEGKAVWAALSYSKDVVITACADTFIRIFHLPSSTGSFQEVSPYRKLSNDDVVRALCRFPAGVRHPTGADFASAGNDSIIKLWKIDGTQVASLYGHESFIYSLAPLPTGELVSSGEDRTVRVWRGKTCVQAITLPAISVWQVAVCQENGDIAAGTSDGVVRIFTRSPERAADPGTISEFDAAVQHATVKGTKVDRKDVKTREWLQTAKGTKHKQVTMVLEDDESIAAYQWSEATDEWTKIGTVVDSEEAVQKRKKVEYQGKEYDYVFDVDTEDGKPPHKLPYNLGDDTYQAATKFLNDNSLPMSYLEAVAAFIRENTAEARQSGDGASGTAKTPVDDPTTRYLPHTTYLNLTQSKLEPAFRRLKESNNKEIQAGNKHIAMNPDDVNRLEALVDLLSRPSRTTIPAETIDVVFRLLTQWPYGSRLPVLDMLRCMAARPGLASFPQWRRYGNAIGIALRSALDQEQYGIDSAGGSATFTLEDVRWDDVNPNSLMMALRTITNLFGSTEGRAMVSKDAGTVVGLMGRIAGISGQTPFGTSNANVQTALITTAFNYACLAYNERQGPIPQRSIDTSLLSHLLKIAAAVARDQSADEILFRAVMTIGMILSCGREGTQSMQRSELEAVAEQAQRKSQDVRVKGVLAECKKIIG
ncbi:PUL domain-containing protein [Podospora aff. communis PSN243]|uniref:PUL domain-containing protein n=1 Tax=Podospora aff. communis PSN243 TaxID=3040156 RepID=A0AAV9H252_9PEZI|nr:PUL domain-containing protein [Podospora aff. communis PSN243]